MIRSLGLSRIMLLLLCFMKATIGEAHPSPHSSIELDVQPSEVRAELKMPLEQLSLALGHDAEESPQEYLARYRSDLTRYIAQHVRVHAPDSPEWQIQLDGNLTISENENPVDIIARVKLIPPGDTSTRVFTLESDLIQHFIISHRIFIVLRNEARIIDVLRFLHNSTLINLDRGDPWKGFVGTFRLGLKHIAEGTDHLLFLLMLLLPAPLLAADGRWKNFIGVKSSLLQLLRVITAFTLGHSITLVLGGFGVVHPPAAPVEVLIALSVFITGLHALRPIFPRREFLIAAGFGLIHGLAFSSAIAEFGLEPQQLMISVLGFNLGIETMQLAIVLAIAPLIFGLSQIRIRWYQWTRVSCASLGLVAATVWLYERLF